MKHRIGKFRATHQALTSPEAHEIFSQAKIVPLGVMWDYMHTAEITALSPLFDESPVECVAPIYTFVITRAEDGTITVKAEREAK